MDAIDKALSAFHAGREMVAKHEKLKAEVERLSVILREVRFRCHYERDRDTFTRVWPLVIDFDDPCDPPVLPRD